MSSQEADHDLAKFCVPQVEALHARSGALSSLGTFI